MIPEAAVEAAARAFYGTALDDVSPEDLEYAKEGARAALEAAAPHLLAEAKADAWEEGCSEGLSWNPGYDDEALAQNPYRTSK